MNEEDGKPPSPAKEQVNSSDPDNMVDEFPPSMVLWYLGRQGANGIGGIALSGIYPSRSNRHIDLLEIDF